MIKAIPFVDFGGSGETIHFAPANGFPPRSYQEFLNGLLPNHHVLGMNARPLWEGSKAEDFHSWETGADDLIHFLDEQGLSGIIGMGHSFGAICTAIAASKRPDLFSRLVLIEPVVLPKWYYPMVNILPVPIIKKINPVLKKTLVRRDHWPDREAAFKQFRRSKLFASISDRPLWDYVNAVMRDDPQGGVFLSYSKQWEAQIFLTVYDPWKVLKKLKHPFLVVRGETSDTIFPHVWEKLKSVNPNGTFLEIEKAGHLVPVERPALVSEKIIEYLKT